MELTHPITDRDKIDAMADYLYNKNIRDYVLFEIGINIGIRVTDFTKQQVGFYRRACELGYIELEPSKTKRMHKKVRVPISDDMLELISSYIKDRLDTEYMFPSRKGGGALTRQQVYNILTDAAEHVGIKENIGCHGMRKTFGYWHYYYNKDIRILMDIFNHSNEDITLRYIGVKDEDKKESMKNMNLGVRTI